MLWLQKIAPFDEPFFSFDGYGMHVVGGVGFAAFQVAFSYRFFPRFASSPRFFAYQAGIATAVLLVVELLQYFDPLRHVQLQDIIAQTLGILLTLLFLRRLRPKTI